ncbi:MAG: hypothetical protein R3352_03955 [Salinisphaeraceae bacterium]|nr:hypothetical protein [Salinisphaeraceae bacterium]
MSKKQAPPKRRNPMHDHPLLKKGGKHERTRKAERRQKKIETDKLLDE